MAEETKDVNISTGQGEAEFIQSVLKKKKAIETNRASYERQWLVNIAFLYGKHYFAVDRKTQTDTLLERIEWEFKSLERKKKNRRIVNYILPLYRSLLARLLQMKAQVNVSPLTADDRDITAARVAQEVLEDFWFNVNRTNPVLSKDSSGMMQMLAKLFSFMLVVSKGYLKPYFNKSARGYAFLADETTEGEIGAVECEVIPPFYVYDDPMNRFMIQQKILSLDDIYSAYEVEIPAESIGMSEVEKQLMNLLEGATEERYENSARIYEYWELPSKKNPKGVFSVHTEKKIILKDVIPPEYRGRLPYFGFNMIDIPLARYPQAMVEQLISSQEHYNYIATRFYEYAKYFAGKLKVPRLCKLESSYDDEIGQVVRYDPNYGEPHFEAGANPPSFLIREIERIRRDMEDIAAVHDVSLSRTPRGVTSGIAIENLTELDNSQLSPHLLHIEQQLGFFAETVLNIIEDRYSEPRILGITGKTLATDVHTFKGEDVKGLRRIKISLGSSLPTSKTERQNFILMLAEKGYIPKEKVLDFLELANFESIFHDIDETGEKSEIQEMLKGNEIVPMEWENHTKRVKVLTDFMMSEEFKKVDPAAQEMMMKHRKMHQEFLRAEREAADQMLAQKQPGIPGEPGG